MTREARTAEGSLAAARLLTWRRGADTARVVDIDRVAAVGRGRGRASRDPDCRGRASMVQEVTVLQTRLKSAPACSISRDPWQYTAVRLHPATAAPKGISSFPAAVTVSPSLSVCLPWDCGYCRCAGICFWLERRGTGGVAGRDAERGRGRGTKGSGIWHSLCPESGGSTAHGVHRTVQVSLVYVPGSPCTPNETG